MDYDSWDELLTQKLMVIGWITILGDGLRFLGRIINAKINGDSWGWMQKKI
jgi:hypothetical protein